MRRIIGTLGLIFILSLLGLTSPPVWSADPPRLWVYLGTYTGKGSEGIYLAKYNYATGNLSEPKLAAKVVNPSFLALHPSGNFLFAVSEVGMTNGKKGGAVTGFAVNRETGMLRQINTQLSGGSGPCHLSVDRSGKCLLVANYNSGSIASLPIREDGSLGEAASVIQHQGSSVNKQRQTGPHAHSINVDPGNRFAFAADLGLDKIQVYRLDAEKGTLTPHDPPASPLPPGSGPRHFAFHPNGKLAYASNELTSTVTSFHYDAQAGVLTRLETVSTLPADFRGASTTAETQVHPSGKYVYVSNRGHDSIAHFEVLEDGNLKSKSWTGTQGKTPRNFGIDPRGEWLIVANQDSNNVVVFHIDSKTGALMAMGSPIQLSMPVCVKFLAR